MDPNQQQLLLTGGAKDSTYIDDVFSTFLYTGSGTSTAYNNGIDLQGEGGLVWIKDRDSSNEHVWFDTERGATKLLVSDDDYAEATSSDSLTSFNNNGFTVGNYANANASGPYASWTFRKAKGFFDVVTWTGNSSTTQTISHSLGSLPGCIMAKCTSHPANWAVYHRNLDNENQPASHYLRLNTTNAQIDDDNKFADTEPTATNFTAGNELNENTKTYVAYIFAGGASDEPGSARSVDFDGSGDRLTLGASSDFDFGTGDWTIEGWWKSDQASNASNSQGLFGLGNYQSTGGMLLYQYNGYLALKKSNVEKINISTNPFDKRLNQWVHVAVVKSGSTVTLYLNGDSLASYTDSGSYGDSPQNTMSVGGSDSGHVWYGWISNFRVVKGTAVYTSAFNPPTAGLTDITNTKLLCCNKNTVTGSTVTPGTITANGDPTSSTNTPFDDPKGFLFGEGGDQNLIKCGSYTGNGSSNGPIINLGWEPQWFIVKNATSSNTNWLLFDSMRGLMDSTQNPGEANIKPNSSDAEWDNEYLSPTSRGWRLTNGGSTWVNENNSTFVYIAIRRPDGYVGKPPEAGTEVFAMTTGQSGASAPNYPGGIVVDYQLTRPKTSANSWYTGARLFGAEYLVTNLIQAQMSSSTWLYDYMNGYNTGTSNSDWQSWQWKRHAGFDVVTYTGNGVTGLQIPHSLSKTPEMIWIKSRGSITQWCVGHKGRNGGVNPWNYFSALNTDGGDEDNVIAFNDTAPTSTHFTVGSGETSNANNFNYLTMLFASVDGICKVGSYAGTGSQLSITTGFQPRFVIIKSTSASRNWLVFDTLRGWASGNDYELNLNNTNTQNNSYDFGAPTATGFTANAVNADINATGHDYIYYAHA